MPTWDGRLFRCGIAFSIVATSSLCPLHRGGAIGQEAASAAALLRDFSTYEKPKETAAPLDMQSYKDAMLRGLRQQLPDYMVPSDLMLATDFPLTANGKLNRQNYSCRANKLPTSVTAWVQSVDSALQQRLVALWQEVLGVSHVSAEDDFFSLGQFYRIGAYSAGT